jgi:hypothetical protein
MFLVQYEAGIRIFHAQLFLIHNEWTISNHPPMAFIRRSTLV